MRAGRGEVAILFSWNDVQLGVPGPARRLRIIDRSFWRVSRPLSLPVRLRSRLQHCKVGTRRLSFWSPNGDFVYL